MVTPLDGLLNLLLVPQLPTGHPFGGPSFLPGSPPWCPCPGVFPGYPQGGWWHLLANGRHQVAVAVAQGCHRPLLLLLVEHLELVLGEGLPWLWDHLDDVHDQDLGGEHRERGCGLWAPHSPQGSLGTP